HQYLDEPRFEFFHAAVEHNSAAVDEVHVCEHVLDLFHFVRRHDDRAAAVKIVIQQRIVELLAVQDVEAKRGLIQYQELHVHGHDEREVKLGHHAFGKFAHFTPNLDGGFGQKSLRFRAVKSRMYGGHILEQLQNAYPPRQHSDIGDEADVPHEFLTLPPGIASENIQRSLVWREPDNRVQSGGLACTVWTDQTQNAAFVDA